MSTGSQDILQLPHVAVVNPQINSILSTYLETFEVIHSCPPIETQVRRVPCGDWMMEGCWKNGMIWRWRHGRCLLFFFGDGIHTVSPLLTGRWEEVPEDCSRSAGWVPSKMLKNLAFLAAGGRPDSRLKVKHHPGTRLLAEGYREV